jgi:hypothetical protein
MKVVKTKSVDFQGEFFGRTKAYFIGETVQGKKKFYSAKDFKVAYSTRDII